MTSPLLTVEMLPAPLDHDEITIVARVGDAELARVIVHPGVVPAERGEQVAGLVAGLLRDALWARGTA